MTVSLDDQIKCVRRELAMRQRVYPKWVTDGRLKQDKADKELAAMQAVHDSLTAYAEAIRSTASQGTYDEAAIRKAVGFGLAEMIVQERTVIQQTAYCCPRTSDLFS